MVEGEEVRKRRKMYMGHGEKEGVAGEAESGEEVEEKMRSWLREDEEVEKG